MKKKATPKRKKALPTAMKKRLAAVKAGKAKRNSKGRFVK